jgi:hypothetical protein
MHVCSGFNGRKRPWQTEKWTGCPLFSKVSSILTKLYHILILKAMLMKVTMSPDRETYYQSQPYLAFPIYPLYKVILTYLPVILMRACFVYFGHLTRKLKLACRSCDEINDFKVTKCAYICNKRPILYNNIGIIKK